MNTKSKSKIETQKMEEGRIKKKNNTINLIHKVPEQSHLSLCLTFQLLNGPSFCLNIYGKDLATLIKIIF